jgi:CCR4-NOT transcription complex subunit 6
MPPKRQMLANVHEERPTPRLRQIGVFRVLTYNILAEIYATRQMYPYCPVWALNWSFRREILQRELQAYNADIICLQVSARNPYGGTETGINSLTAIGSPR